MKDSEIVAAAQDLIRDPDNWLKARFCRRRGFEEPDAFCVEGALREVLDTLYLHENGEIANERFWKICPELHDVAQGLFPNVMPDVIYDPRRIAFFNDADAIDHPDVMTIMDKTRAQMEEQGR